jgi:hypothetical protein
MQLPLKRLPLMALGLLALLSALWFGLVRIGWALPAPDFELTLMHGALMVCGFLGTLVSLERAVALRRPWAYTAPACAALSVLALLVGLPAFIARLLIVLAAVALVAVFGAIIRIRFDAAHATMGIGAGLWLLSSALWLWGLPMAAVVPWWAGFLILTIAGERLELARALLLNATARALFIVVNTLFVLGLLISLFTFDVGMRVSGVGLIALSAWLLRYDLARRTIRQTGITQFIAACLLSGYVWLMIGGMLWLGWGGYYLAGPLYDAQLHTIFLGFVFAMIFGHAPIIIPAVMRVHIRFNRAFYAPLVLLHLTLILRILGDLMLNPTLRLWGGLLNALVVLWFMATLALAVRAGAAGESTK